ncbi:MAG: hypothetical protein NC350_05210 [Corallococcus sp.]|nr:hypothetical protein [Corallococcus sp.]
MSKKIIFFDILIRKEGVHTVMGFYLPQNIRSAEQNILNTCFGHLQGLRQKESIFFLVSVNSKISHFKPDGAASGNVATDTITSNSVQAKSLEIAITNGKHNRRKGAASGNSATGNNGQERLFCVRNFNS